MTVLEINQLQKSFNEKTVINELTLSVETGEIYGFIGNNGTGKTTTMKMILGLLKQDSGAIYICGERVTFGDTLTNRHIGYLPDVPEFYTYMYAAEYLNLCAEITGLNKRARSTRIPELLALVGLTEVNTRIKGYSRGMKQRLGIAQALIHKPKLLICDEPTSALDPGGRMEILNILKQIKNETTVIFSTHILTDVERICDKAGILHDGRIVQSFDLKTADFGNKGILLKLTDDEYHQLNSQLPLEYSGNSQYSTDSVSLQEVYDALHKNNIYPEAVIKQKKTLEDVYLEVTS